jgi:hypothetical protein
MSLMASASARQTDLHACMELPFDIVLWPADNGGILLTAAHE